MFKKIPILFSLVLCVACNVEDVFARLFPTRALERDFRMRGRAEKIVGAQVIVAPGV